jgi:hypothetical protein
MIEASDRGAVRVGARLVKPSMTGGEAALKARVRFAAPALALRRP